MTLRLPLPGKVPLGVGLLLLALIPCLGAAQAAVVTIPPPPVTAGLELRYAADWFQTSAGGPLLGGRWDFTSWGDLSGKGRDLSLQPGNARPRYIGFAANGHKTVRFDGAATLMKTYGSTFTLPQPNTFFVVYHQLEEPTGPAFVFDSRDSSQREVLGRPATGQTTMYANLDLQATAPTGGFQIWSGTFNGASSALYRNGVQVAAGNAGTSGLSGFTLGGLSGGGSYGYNFSRFDVAEILVYSGAMSDADRQAVTSWLDTTYAISATPAGSAPVNLTPPVVSPPATTGFASSLGFSGDTWSPTGSLTWQWQRCDAAGTNCVDKYEKFEVDPTISIPPPTVTVADVGYTFRVKETAFNLYGTTTVVSATSSVVPAPAVPTLPTNKTSPTISGLARVGETLTTANGTWTGTQPITFTTYRWLRCNPTCVDIPGATSSTYTLTSADAGATIKFVVTAANANGQSNATSDATLAILTPTGPAGSPPVATGLQLWVDADTETYANGAPVTKWTDKSSFKRDLTAGNPSQAPIFRRTAANGRGALEFDGVRSLLKSYGSTFTLAQPDTVFVVYRSLDADTAARGFVFDSVDATKRQAFGRVGAGDVRMYANTEVAAGGVAYPFPTVQVWSVKFNGSSSEIWRNGTRIATGSAGAASLGGLTVGGLSTSGQYGYDLTHAQIAEILVYQGSSFHAGDDNRKTVTDWLLAKYNPFAVISAPANTVTPAISGSPLDGSTLTATAGTWSGTDPIDIGYQWQRCNAAGSGCAAIGVATGSSYTLGSADIGFRIALAVTATNAGGSATASAGPTAVVTAVAPTNTTAPSVSGLAHEGGTLTATGGSWTGTQPLTLAYAWQRCDSAGASCAPAATGSSYTVTGADVGATIRIAVTASNTAGNATATSTVSGVVTNAASPPVGAGLELWYRADDQSYSDGAAVMRWSDGSGRGRDLTAFDAGQAPTFRANALNGHAAIEFDGRYSLLKTYGSTFTLPQPTTFFIVYRSLDTGEAYVFDSTDSSIRQILGLASSGNTVAYANIGLEAPAGYPFPGYQIWSGSFNGSGSTLWRNNTRVGQGSAGGSALKGFTLGGLNSAAQWGYNYSHALVAEILFYTGALSDTERSAITGWLNERYTIY